MKVVLELAANKPSTRAETDAAMIDTFAGGKRIAKDGEEPLNTNGGQLSAGRLHGYGFLHEACVQLWHEGGERQVPGNPEVAIAAAGGGPLGSCILLTRT